MVSNLISREIWQVGLKRDLETEWQLIDRIRNSTTTCSEFPRMNHLCRREINEDDDSEKIKKSIQKEIIICTINNKDLSLDLCFPCQTRIGNCQRRENQTEKNLKNIELFLEYKPNREREYESISVSLSLPLIFTALSLFVSFSFLVFFFIKCCTWLFQVSVHLSVSLARNLSNFHDKTWRPHSHVKIFGQFNSCC